ncbi:MAG TPA: AraC family transcriptional regulator ligand-binding domain-containing protein [Geminicoccaceae bacterium]|nr:AraC family transcriptional regulator ligand-binding domain-containing protein [Geminicoccus sp.]HMU49317.1 AraC family transcriptional regulator ligand-binding domain-containing protein [Geminicoccaceae bacterium]
MGPLPRLVRDMASEAVLLRLLRQSHLPVAVLENPGLRIPVRDLAMLFSEAARTVGDSAFGLRVGAAMAPTDYGAFARYSLAAPTLGRGLGRLVRSIGHYQQDGCIFVESSGPLVRMGYRTPFPAAPFTRHHGDHVISPLIQFGRAFLGADWRPSAIEVPYARDSHHLRALDTYLGVPVCWSRPAVALLFPREVLAARRRPSFAVQPLSRSELRDLLGRPRRPTVSDLVAEIVALRLQDGRVDLDGAAARLGMHRRALQRALAGEGVTYRNVTERVMRLTAERELSQSDQPIADLALALGFSEPQHFTRAFRRWTGVAPSAYRSAVAGG